MYIYVERDIYILEVSRQSREGNRNNTFDLMLDAYAHPGKVKGSPPVKVELAILCVVCVVRRLSAASE